MVQPPGAKGASAGRKQPVRKAPSTTRSKGGGTPTKQRRNPPARKNNTSPRRAPAGRPAPKDNRAKKTRTPSPTNDRRGAPRSTGGTPQATGNPRSTTPRSTTPRATGANPTGPKNAPTGQQPAPRGPIDRYQAPPRAAEVPKQSEVRAETNKGVQAEQQRVARERADEVAERRQQERVATEQEQRREVDTRSADSVHNASKPATRGGAPATQDSQSQEPTGEVQAPNPAAGATAAPAAGPVVPAGGDPIEGPLGVAPAIRLGRAAGELVRPNEAPNQPPGGDGPKPANPPEGPKPEAPKPETPQADLPNRPAPEPKDRLTKLAEEAQGETVDPGRAAYDQRIAEQLEVDGKKVTGIRHDPNGFTEFNLGDEKMRISYGSGDIKDIVEGVRYRNGTGTGSIIDVGAMTPKQVKKLEAKLKAEGLEATIHNPYGQDAIDLAQRHARGDLVAPGPDGKKVRGDLSFEEASSLRRSLDDLGPDARVVAAGEEAIAAHFGRTTENMKLPEYLLERDGKYYAAELKNTAAPGRPHTGKPSDIEHAVEKFRDLDKAITEKYGKEAVGGFEIHARAGAHLGEGFTVGDGGQLLKDGKPVDNVRVRGLDLPATDGVVQNPQAFKPQDGEAPGARIPREPDPLPTRNIDDIELGPKLGQGGHKVAYDLPNGDVAVMFPEGKRGNEAADFIRRESDTLRDLQGIEHNGRNIAPEIKEVLTDADGRPVGYVMEKVPGKELGELAREGKLTPEQMKSVRTQLEGQMEALHGAGRIHGDPNPGNILVDVKPDGSVDARFIDFWEKAGDFGAQDDADILQRTLQTAEHDITPERQAGFQRKREAKQLDADQRKFVDVERTHAEEARDQLKALRRNVAGEADKEALSEIQRTLGMDGKEARMWKQADFEAAAKKLADTGAADRLRGLDLADADPEVQKLRDDLLKKVEGFERNWGHGPGRKPPLPEGLNGLDAKLQEKLTPDDVDRMAKIGGDEAGQRALADWVNKAESPEMAKEWLDRLETVDPKHRGALTKALKDMDPKTASDLLARTIDGKPGAMVMGDFVARLPDASQAAGAKMLAAMDPQTTSAFLKMAKDVDPKILGEVTGLMSKLDPTVMKHAGAMFEEVAGMMAKHGVPMTGAMAGRALKGTAKMLGKWTPVVGAGFAGYDTVRMAQIAANNKLPPEIRYLGGLGVAVNGADTVLGVAEMFPPVNVGLPVNLALGAGSLGLDLYTHHLIDQFEAGNFKSTPGLDTAIVASSAAMGPAGMAMLYGTFGHLEANRKILNAGNFASEKSLQAMAGTGMLAADAAGGGLRLTANGVDGLADMIRNPEKFGEMADNFALGTQQLGRNALGALGAMQQMQNQLGAYAGKQLMNAGGWLAAQGERGLDTLAWMAQNPGAMRDAAQRGFQQAIQKGGEFGRAAWDQAVQAKQAAFVMGEQFVGGLQQAGANGAAMLRYAAENPGEAAAQIRQRATDGLAEMVRRGQAGAGQALANLVQMADDYKTLGRDAVNHLRDLAVSAPQKFQQVADRWGKNLSEGGAEVMRSLHNLGDAGTEALGRMGRAGGEMAVQAAQHLEAMARNGIASAARQLQAVLPKLSDEQVRGFYMGADIATRSMVLSVMDESTVRKLGNSIGHRNIQSTVQNMQRMGIPVPQGVTRAVNLWQNRGVRNLTGAVADQQFRRVVPVPRGKVSPFHPDAQWIFGIRNPFR